MILKRNTLFDLIILGDISSVLHLQMEFYCNESVKLYLTALKMTIFLSKVKVLNIIIPYSSTLLIGHVFFFKHCKLRYTTYHLMKSGGTEFLIP